MRIDEPLFGFIEFLNASLGSVVQALSAIQPEMLRDELLATWGQANWEILVESAVRSSVGPLYLPVYGEGAEGPKGSGRVAEPAAVPTHSIVVKPKAGSQVSDLITGATFEPGSLDFYQFGHVSIDRKFSVQLVPINAALFHDEQGNEYLAAILDCEFNLAEFVP